GRRKAPDREGRRNQSAHESPLENGNTGRESRRPNGTAKLSRPPAKTRKPEKPGWRPRSVRQNKASSALLSHVADKEPLGVLNRLELRRPLLAGEIVTDPERVTFQLVDCKERLPLVRPFGAGDVHCLGLRR